MEEEHFCYLLQLGGGGWPAQTESIALIYILEHRKKLFRQTPTRH
jgi:hypothetical protein